MLDFVPILDFLPDGLCIVCGTNRAKDLQCQFMFAKSTLISQLPKVYYKIYPYYYYNTSFIKSLSNNMYHLFSLTGSTISKISSALMIQLLLGREGRKIILEGI